MDQSRGCTYLSLLRQVLSHPALRHEVLWYRTALLED